MLAALLIKAAYCNRYCTLVLDTAISISIFTSLPNGIPTKVIWIISLAYFTMHTYTMLIFVTWKMNGNHNRTKVYDTDTLMIHPWWFFAVNIFFTMQCILFDLPCWYNIQFSIECNCQNLPSTVIFQ